MSVEITLNGAKKPLCKALLAGDPLSRCRGLMFRPSPVPILFDFAGEGIWPIHSLFVFFAFDAVYLDSQKRVVEAIPKISPWKFLVMPKFRSRYLLELPPGGSSGIRAGDTLGW